MSEPFTLTLDSHQIKTFLECDEKYRLAHIEHLRKTRFFKATKVEAAPDLGTTVHAILDVYYTLKALAPHVSGIKHGTTVINLIKKQGLCQKMGFDKAQEAFIIERFQQYTFNYMNGDFHPLVRGGVPAVEVGFSKVLYKTPEVVFILEGRIDMLSELWPGAKCFIDHKTQDRISTLYEYKPQIKTYALATGFNYGMFNYFGVQAKFSEMTFRRPLIYIPDWMIEEWRTYIIEHVYWPIYVYKELEGSYSWPKNFSSCGGQHEKWPCPFTKICEERGETQALIKKQFYEKTKPWSPWTDNEDKLLEIEELAE